VVERRGQAIWPAVLLGVTISIKWAALPVMIPVGYVLWRKGLLRPFLAGLWFAALLYIAIVYVERLIIVTANPVQAWVEVWEWHLQAARKIGAAVPHLWGSPWWSWPIMLRPIRYFYGANPDGALRIVLAIGNPLVWWASTLAVVAGLVEVARKVIARKPFADDPLVPIVLGYVFLCCRGCRAPGYRTSTTTWSPTPSPSWRLSTGCAGSGTDHAGDRGPSWASPPARLR
jgi:hypothetical protein